MSKTLQKNYRGQSRMQRLRENMWRARYLYLMMIPVLAAYILFHYFPMAGIQLAFKTYNARLGIWGSKWVGFKHFERLFRTPEFSTALSNTLIISFSRLVFEFPFPIILAILINEMRGKRIKKIYQTIYTFPHFLSWVIVGSILTNFFSSTGPFNELLRRMGMSGKTQLLADGSIFRYMLYGTNVWKTAGWSAIIYMSAIVGIDPQLYEAATVDGATRIQRIWYITLPGILSTIVVMFILQVGNIMSGGFDQIFNLSNAVVRPVSDILDTYVYRITFEALPDYGFSTAVGLFKAVINLFMLVAANRVSRWITGQGLFA